MLDHFSKQVFLTSTEAESAERCYRFSSVFSPEDKVVQEIDAEINVIYKSLVHKTVALHKEHRCDVCSFTSRATTEIPGTKSTYFRWENM